ncbi:MAG: septum site-determining protein MinC [Tissierellales bacterium]|jgi:septum site-determining protein MinC|nr:septum site-determining protein MinC [Tissierellales bacterium]
MVKEQVSFKGNIKEGLYLKTTTDDFNVIYDEIEEKLEKYYEFYQDCSKISIRNGLFDEVQREKLEKLFSEKLSAIVEYYDEKKTEIASEESSDHEEKVGMNTINRFVGIEEDYTLFVKATMRSGQSITYNGSVIVFGDVNPGAEITATGNIIIYGNLRGVVHAGCEGNRDAIVYSKLLQPIQLRIADLIAISSDDDFVPQGPEIARIEDNQVMIEAE